jgi:hypothetical protein
VRSFLRCGLPAATIAFGAFQTACSKIAAVVGFPHRPRHRFPPKGG